MEITSIDLPEYKHVEDKTDEELTQVTALVEYEPDAQENDLINSSQNSLADNSGGVVHPLEMLVFKDVKIDFPNLFTYLYRRFGPPKTPREHHDDRLVAVYNLLADDVCLHAKIMPTDQQHFMFAISVPKKFAKELDDYDWREAHAVYEAFGRHLRDHQEAYDVFKAELSAMKDRDESYVDGMSDRDLGMFLGMLPGIQKLLPADFLHSTVPLPEFNGRKPRVQKLRRSKDISKWDADDPMLKLYNKLCLIRDDLLSPTYVHGVAINMAGVVDTEEFTYARR